MNKLVKRNRGISSENLAQKPGGRISRGVLFTLAQPLCGALAVGCFGCPFLLLDKKGRKKRAKGFALGTRAAQAAAHRSARSVASLRFAKASLKGLAWQNPAFTAEARREHRGWCCCHRVRTSLFKGDLLRCQQIGVGGRSEFAKPPPTVSTSMPTNWGGGPIMSLKLLG